MSYDNWLDRPIAFEAEPILCTCGHPADCGECESCGDHCHLNALDAYVEEYQARTVEEQVKGKR